MFCKKGVLRNFAKFTGKHLRQSLFFLQAWACNFIKKETLAQMFSSEFCKISKDTFSYRTPAVAASEQRICCGLLFTISMVVTRYLNKSGHFWNFLYCLCISSFFSLAIYFLPLLLCHFYTFYLVHIHFDFNPLSASPTKWSNTLKLFVDKSRVLFKAEFKRMVTIIKYIFTKLEEYLYGAAVTIWWCH